MLFKETPESYRTCNVITTTTYHLLSWAR